MRVLVTGSRTWTDAVFIHDVLDEVLALRLKGFVLVHGAAHRGADYIAMRWGVANAAQGVSLEPHPADWRRRGKGAGMARNAEMVAAGADYCIAFIRDHSRGATHCAELARKAGIETRVYEWEQVFA